MKGTSSGSQEQNSTLLLDRSEIVSDPAVRSGTGWLLLLAWQDGGSITPVAGFDQTPEPAAANGTSRYLNAPSQTNREFGEIKASKTTLGISTCLLEREHDVL